MADRRPPIPAGTLGTLGDLLAQRGLTPGPASAPPPEQAAPAVAPPPRPRAEAPDLSGCGKVVLRRERKGHGGKSTTVVAGLGLSGPDLDRIAKGLRRALGCGASVAGDQLIVQGDQTARVRDWLAAQGARRIVVGN